MIHLFSFAYVTPAPALFLFLQAPMGVNNRDWCNERSWRVAADNKEYIIMNHSVIHAKCPEKKGCVRWVYCCSMHTYIHIYLYIFLLRPLTLQTNWLTHPFLIYTELIPSWPGTSSEFAKVEVARSATLLKTILEVKTTLLHDLAVLSHSWLFCCFFSPSTFP